MTVDVVLGGALEMFPAAISQKEKQLVRLTGNLYAFLPYPVTPRPSPCICQTTPSATVPTPTSRPSPPPRS